MKRVIAIALVLLLALQWVPASGQSDDETPAARGGSSTALDIAIGALLAAGAYLLLHHHAHSAPPPTPTSTPVPVPSPPPTPHAPPTPEETPPVIISETPSPTQTCPPSKVAGWLEPTQGVWQDDYKFDDHPTKQLSQLSPASYDAELDMVKDRDSLLFGIFRPAGEPEQERRNTVTVYGTTYNTVQVYTNLRITLDEGGHQTVLYRTGALYPVYLLGPCAQQPHEFHAVLDASRGIPPPPAAPFHFNHVGPYSITAELYNGDVPTGFKAVVFGKTVDPHGPKVTFVPMVSRGDRSTFVDRTFDMAAKARELAETTAHYAPIYYPLVPGSLTTVARMPRTLDAMLAKAKDKAQADFSQNQLEANNQETIAAELVDEFNAIAPFQGQSGRMVVLLENGTGNGIVTNGTPPESAPGTTMSTKVIFLENRPDQVNFLTVLHEIVHTEPEALWSDPQMIDKCDFDYHNNGNTDVRADGTKPRGLQSNGSIVGVAYGVRTQHVEDVGYERELGTPGDLYLEQQLPNPPASMASVMGLTNPPLMRERFVRAYEIMGSTGVPPNVPKKRWITQCTYWHLVDAFQQGQDPHVLQVRALLTRSAAGYGARLHSLYESEGIGELKTGNTRGWAIVLRNAAGGTLATYPFTPGWKYADDLHTRNVIAIAYAVPDVAGSARIEIARGTATLAHLDRSAHAPTLAILSPHDGSITGDRVHVAWRAQSASDHAVRSSLFTSSDRGKTWNDEFFDETRDAYDLAAPRRGHEAWLKITVNDGARTTEQIVKYRR